MPDWKLFYHITWGTKIRLSLITPDLEAPLHSAIAAKAIDIGAIVHAVGGIENHIHLAVSVPPKIALSDFIGQVKGNSSHAVNHVFQPGSNFRWQEEYGIHSFDEKILHFIVKYIHAQHEHHQQDNLFNHLERVE